MYVGPKRRQLRAKAIKENMEGIPSKSTRRRALHLSVEDAVLKKENMDNPRLQITRR